MKRMGNLMNTQWKKCNNYESSDYFIDLCNLPSGVL